MDTPNITKIPNLAYLAKPNVLTTAGLKPGSWAIYHPQSVDTKDLAQLRRGIDTDQYFVQLGYLAYSIQSPRILTRVPCRTRFSLEPPASADELSSILEGTFDLYFVKTWNDLIPDSFLEACRKLLMEAIDPSDAAVIKCNGQIKGVVTVSPQVDCLGTQVLQIPWIWIDGKVEGPERQKIHSVITGWLQSKRLNGFSYKAGIHLFNERSQNFFAKLGFTLRCVHILRR